MIPIIAAIGIGVLSTLTEKAVTALIDHARGGHTAADPGKPSFNAVLERSQRTPSTRPPTKGCTHPHSEHLAPSVTSGPATEASLSLLTAQLAEQRSLAHLSSLLTTHQRTAHARKAAGHGSVLTAYV